MSVGVRPSGGGFEGLSKGEVFALLCNDRRRYLLRYLARADPPVELGELATLVAARECGVEAGRVTAKQRKRVYTTLQQFHLPKMDEAGVLEFDADRGTVGPTEYTEAVAVYLEVVPRSELPWREYYLALGAVFAGVGAALWVGVYPLVLLPELAWAALFAALLAGSAAVQVLHQRRRRLRGPDVPWERPTEDPDSPE